MKNFLTEQSRKALIFAAKSFYRENVKKIGEYKYNLLIAFVQSTTLSMCKQWITDGKKISLEEIISLTSELLIDGMKKFLS